MAMAMAVQQPRFVYDSLTILLFLLAPILPIAARKPHHISFRSPDLYPESVVWDSSAQHFIVGSLRRRSIHSVSDAGVVDTLIYDPSLPTNSTILGLAIDRHRRRLLAAVHAIDPLPEFNALAAYDLLSGSQLFLTPLPHSGSASRDVANDVAVDFQGNAYVTNSAADQIWKVTVDGEASIFSRSPAFTKVAVDRDVPRYCGLNGIAYASRGHLLVVQTSTGKMFKVDVDDGKAKEVLLNKDLPSPEGIAIRSDGAVLVVSPNKLWFLKSNDGWLEGVAFDGTSLDADKYPTSVTMGGEDRAYVLYGRTMEGILGIRPEGSREWFEIEEVRSEEESKDEKLWVYVLLGLGLAYFMFWRFQMKKLVQNLDKKHS